MDILVKITGSLIDDEKFYSWISSIINPSDNLFVLVGGGDAITKILKKKTVPYEFGPQGREINSLKGRQLAWEALSTEKAVVECKLKDKGINAAVFMPVIKIGEKILHMNGDSYALALYPSFDKLYIVTLKGRVKSFPNNLNKLEVVYL